MWSANAWGGCLKALPCSEVPPSAAQRKPLSHCPAAGKSILCLYTLVQVVDRDGRGERAEPKGWPGPHSGTELRVPSNLRSRVSGQGHGPERNQVSARLRVKTSHEKHHTHAEWASIVR